MTPEFNQWWDNDLLTEDNPFVEGTAAYWAWEGWCAAVKVEQPAQQCRTDGRCQYAIDSGAEGMGHCPKGKCVMPAQQEPEFFTHCVDQPYDWSEWVCPDPKGYLMKCCDCGLVHEAEFGVVRYKSETEREECDMVGDPNLQAVFRMRRSEQWSPADMAHRSGGLTMEQPQQEQGDSICQEGDGCPTEKAVLQRFWRGEPIPTEHYPSWFKPAQHLSGWRRPMKEEWLLNGAVVPVDVETTSALVAEIKRLIGVVGGMALAQPEQPAQQEPVAWICEGSQHDEKHSIDYWPGDVDDLPIGTKLYTQAQRTWVGLADEERIMCRSYDPEEAVAKTEAKLREKNA